MSRRMLHMRLRSPLTDASRWLAVLKGMTESPSLRVYDAQDGRGFRYQYICRKRSDVRPDEYLENDLERLVRARLFTRGVLAKLEEVERELNGRIRELEQPSQ